MAGAECAKLIRGKMARFGKLDACGEVVPGPLNAVITKGLITVTMTPTNYAGTAIQLPNATGELEIDDTPAPKFQNWGVSIAMIGVNPILVSLLTNQETWEGVEAGTVTGFTVGDDVDPEEFGFWMELWSGTSGTLCEDGAVKYGWFLLPRLRSGAVGAITWANDAINLTIDGAITVAPNAFGVGPFDVTLDSGGDPAPLRQALGTRKHFLFDQVTLAPPVDECGGVPIGQAPTSATAGIPGTFAPSGSWLPANLAALSGVTASPSTAWTTGQYVLLGDGSKAHWTSSAWAANAA